MSRHRFASALTQAAIVVAIPATARAAGVTLLQDDFEGYADTTALLGTWNANPGSNNTLSTNRPAVDPAFTTKADFNPAGTNLQAARTFNPTGIKPSNTTPIYWSVDFFWDGSGNKRMSAGIRTGGATSGGVNILEMGYYNAAYNPADTSHNYEGFAVRTTSFSGASQLPESAPAVGWHLFMNADNTARVSFLDYANKWTTLSALILGDTIVYSLDLGRDGVVDSVYVAKSPTATPLNLTGAAFDTARLGTGLTSGGGGADFDNVLVRSLASGDANHNGKIDPDDYAIIDRGAAKGLTGWANGDFNNDGVINAADYLLIDTSYSQQLGNAPADLLAERAAEFGDDYTASLIAAVPEPTSLSLLAIGALPLLTRRRTAR